jgi:hypothetical protein
MSKVICKDCGQEITEAYISQGQDCNQCMMCYSAEMDHYEYGCDGNGECSEGCTFGGDYE